MWKDRRDLVFWDTVVIMSQVCCQVADLLNTWIHGNYTALVIIYNTIRYLCIFSHQLAQPSTKIRLSKSSYGLLIVTRGHMFENNKNGEAEWIMNIFALKYTHTELSYVVKYRSNISVCTNINIYLYLRKH